MRFFKRKRNIIKPKLLKEDSEPVRILKQKWYQNLIRKNNGADIDSDMELLVQKMQNSSLTNP